jgi:hypothetical protein
VWRGGAAATGAWSTFSSAWSTKNSGAEWVVGAYVGGVVSGIPERWQAMGIFDKAKDAIGEHSEQVDAGIDKAGDFVDEKTDSKYVEQVDQGQDMAKDKLRDFTADQPEQPA